MIKYISMFYILSYITGGLIVLLALFNYIFPSRKTSLLIKSTSDLTSILNCLFILFATHNLNIISGLIAVTIGLIRDILFIYRDKSKHLNNIFIPIIISIIYLSSLIYSYHSIISLLPVIGSVVSTMTLYSNNTKTIKIGALVCYPFYITYYAILIPLSNILTVFSFISSSLLFIGALIGFIIIINKQKKNSTINV